MASSLVNWFLSTLLLSGKVKSESNLTLSTEVINSLKPTQQTKNIVPVTSLDKELDLCIADVLLRLGEYTVPKAATRIGSLARYAPVLKYMSAFQIDKGYLVTSQFIQMAAYRSRATVSEELGIGFSFMAAEKWIRQSFGLTNIKFFDIELIKANKFPNTQHSIGPSKRGMRADWLIRASSDAQPQKEHLFLLESKGTGTKNYYKNESMLPKAIRQVSATTVNGQNLPGLGVCTYSGLGGLTIYSLDPPSGGDYQDLPYIVTPRDLNTDYGELCQSAGDWYELPIESEVSPSQKLDQQFGLNLKSESLSELCNVQSALNLAHWSSNEDLLSSLHGAYGTPYSPVSRSEFEVERTIETSVGAASGYTITLPRTEHALFAGALDQVSGALADHDFESANELNSEARNSINIEGGPPTAENVRQEHLAISDSGAVLALIDLSR